LFTVPFLQSGNLFGRYLKQHGSYLSEGKIKGQLYDIGDYPGLVLTASLKEYVYGSIYQLNNVKETLKIIDDYEGCGPDQHQPNLFVRVREAIVTRDSVTIAWIYIYNLPVYSLRKMPSGKYNLF
jgi:gamma-glutamylcyclotransferase (GGCT)/AIG2-like uncharacterized protein YtfP